MNDKNTNTNIASDKASRMLELRRIIKKKKPVFLRQDFQIKKLQTKWRKAKGIHSKMRRKMAGHILMPNPCFGSPKAVRGLNANGRRDILVNNVNDIANVKNGCCAVIASGVGLRKKLDIAKKAAASGIAVSNLTDVNAFIKNTEEMMKKKKDGKKKTKEQITAQKADEASKAKKDQEKTAEEKAREEKELKRKTLEGRHN